MNHVYDFIKRHSKEFIAGGLLGGIFSGNVLFLNAHSWTGLIWEWVIRAIGTGIIAIISGLATAYSKELFKNWQEYKTLKKKEYDKRKGKSNTGTGRDKDQRAA